MTLDTKDWKESYAYTEGIEQGRKDKEDEIKKKIEKVLSNRRIQINLGITDERLLAHLHTFVNKFEEELLNSLGDGK